MKISITITDESGQTFEGELELSPSRPPKRGRTRGTTRLSRGKAPAERSSAKPDFDLPTRAFMKRYVGEMGGDARFTLLLASLTKGEVGKAVGLSEISKSWNKMTQRMGGRFNPAYPTRAHENGWIASPKRGFYSLRSSWTQILDS